MARQEPRHPQPRTPSVVGEAPADEKSLLRIEPRPVEYTLAITPVAIPALSTSARCEATLMFADLFGYSAFTEERELEQVSAAIGEIKRQAVRIVHRHGGIVNQFVGDEVMAIFGFPKGQADAPLRAAAAALELHAFVRSSNLRQWLGPKRRLQLHSGIDTGTVLIRTRDVRNGLFELTGGAVIRAARLRSAAGADELLVSDKVHERIAASFATEQLQALRFKGSEERALVYRVLHPHAPTHEPTPATAQRALSARSELTQLQRFWADRTAQRGGIVVVKGAAGSGKSRLLSSFASQLSPEGVQVWSLGGRSLASEPFAGLARMVAPPAAHWDWRAVRHELGERQALRPRLVDDTQTLGRFVRAVAGVLCQRVDAGTERHAFVIDDLQWLDPSTLSVIVQLATRLCPQGTVLVCAVRDDDTHAGVLERLLAAVPDALCTQIRLGPLSVDDASDMVAEHLGLPQPSGSQLIEQLSLLSDGTPLNLVELLHLLLEDKYLSAQSADLRRVLDDLQVTPSARSLIERRLRGLSPEAAKLLRALAIMRDPADLGCLLHATRLSNVRAQAAIAEATQARLLDLDAAGEPRFAHDVIWEVLLLDMPAEEQQHWHKRAARALRALPDLDDKQRFTLARHCAAGLLVEDPRGSFDALCRAARLARADHDEALALSFLQPAARAAALGGFEPSTDFHCELAETALRVGELHAAFEAFQLAARRLPAGIERAHVLGKLAWIEHFHATGHPARNLEQALRECGEPVSSHRLGALGTAAATHVQKWVQRGPRSSLRQREILCGLYIGLCRVYLDGGQVALALAAVAQLAAAADDLGACRVRAEADAMLGFCLGLLRADKRSRDRFARSHHTALQLEDPAALAHYHQISQVLAGYRGDFEAAERHAHECVVVRGPYMELSELCLVSLGQFAIELYRGRVDRALEWAFHSVERIQQYGHAPAVFSLIEEAVCGVFVSRGQQDEVVRLKSRLRFVRRSELGAGGLYHLLTFMCRALYVSAPELPNHAFEALVAEFAALGLHAKQLPVGMSAYFVQVAHVRVTQCLRSRGSERCAYLAKLRVAVADVEATTRTPMMFGHTKSLQAAMAWLDGDALASERLSNEAEALARTHGLPWVSFAVARLRAHVLRDQGKLDAALDQARVAAVHASQYGLTAQLQLIREELEVQR
jgi:eukaryotic-like serine/threonine-protein kinase